MSTPTASSTPSIASRDSATEYAAGSSGESLRACPSWSHTIAVWSADRSVTVAANICDDAANPCVSSTAGPRPIASWKMPTAPSAPVMPA